MLYCIAMRELSDIVIPLGIHISPQQAGQFELYRNELIRWNENVNLTSIRSPADIELKHFADSLACVKYIPEGATSMIDIGTGAGFPALPIKIVLPGLRVALVESRSKKTAFLNHIITLLGLGGIEVINLRAETAAHDSRYRENFDIAISRAVASLDILSELCLPFCKIGGRFLAPKSGDVYGEIESAHHAIDVLGAGQVFASTLELGPQISRRYVVSVEKTGPTPSKYPRKPGIPAKRPL